MKEASNPAGEKFRRLLQDFVFFHLGADARLQVDEEGDGLLVHVEHHRVEPFTFRLSQDLLRSLAEDPLEAENFLLDRMNAHRR